MKSNNDTPAGTRVDKWLWCARFYKTRNQSAESVRNGKVLVNDRRARPAYHLQTGDRLCIKSGALQYIVTVTGMAKTRKSAAEAGTLYLEDTESIRNRELFKEQLRLNNGRYPQTHGRPTKRERRKLMSFKNYLD